MRLTEAFALDVLMGLSSAPKHIPSKYFYDDIGSRLFERIMGLPEYYPTGCEREVFERQHPRLVEVLSGEPLLLVELGPGNGVKTRLLLRALRERSQPFRYV
ncbi:MAG: L-histidine N(alpha)-methyltransferase, partial [Actinomycetota bacterium]